MQTEEIWKDIKGFEGKYQISNLGRVRNIVSGRYLNPFQNPKIEYYMVGIRKDGRYYFKYIHRLIAEVFIPNPYNYPQVNHKNEIRTDNRIENLEWCNNQYNNEYSHGKPINQFLLSGEFVKKWKSGRHIKREMGFDESVIGKVCRGKIRTAYGYKWEFAKES